MSDPSLSITSFRRNSNHITK